MEPTDRDRAVEFFDPDAAHTIADARQAVARKRQSGVYGDGLLAELRRPLPLEPDPDFFGGRSWPGAQATMDVEAAPPPVSQRPLTGPLVVAVKRGVRRLLHDELFPLTSRLTTHHRAVVAVMDEHNHQLAALRAGLDRLQGEVDGLKADRDRS